VYVCSTMYSFSKLFNMNSGYVKGILLTTAVAVLTACSGIDIDDEIAVMNDIQGTWIGYELTGSTYRHIKVNITDNSFDGWLQISDSITEPAWTVLPTESGTFSLSSVLENASDAGKYRKFNFVILHRCCGDNSLTARTLSEMVTYDDGKGLYVAGRASMIRR